MPAYIGQVATPRVASRLIARVVSDEKVFPGQYVSLTQLRQGIADNIGVWDGQQPTAQTIKENALALIVNDGFETLLDGRRPAGEPNYYHYAIEGGECYTAIFLQNHLVYYVGLDAIDEATADTAEIGSYLVPQIGSNLWTVTDTLGVADTCALKILGFKNLPVGGAEYQETAPVAVCVGRVNKANGGNDFLMFALPDQVGETTIDRVQDTISLFLAGDITSQVADFELSPEATAYVRGIKQQSGVTENDFSAPVDYDVVAGNGDNAHWVVVATYAPYSVTSILSDAHCTVTLKTEEGTEVGVGINNVHYNQALTVSVTLDEGYGLGSLLLNGKEIPNESTFEVKGNVSIEATSQAL